MNRVLMMICCLPLMVLGQGSGKAKESLSKIMLPKGYLIEIYADKLTDAREMDIAEDGTLFVGSGKEGKVYAVKPDRSVVIIDDSLDMPAGVDYFEGNLYVAEVSRILKYENILQTMDTMPKPVVLNANLPKDKENGTKFIRVGPEGKLYIPVGAPCNACIPDNTWHARILRMTLDGQSLEDVADGVRYTGGFDWDPVLGEMWFNDNNRTDDVNGARPDELNKMVVAGASYGFPYIAGKMLDQEFWPQRPKNVTFTTPIYELPAQLGASGMRFYSGQMFDKKYQGGMFIAEHGSGDKTKETGCRISYVTVYDGRAIKYEVFAGGWLQGETAWGTPVDVQVGPDGSLFVSDDLNGCVYRIYK
jgi:glucose/arabinose dehydrogenase